MKWLMGSEKQPSCVDTDRSARSPHNYWDEAHIYVCIHAYLTLTTQPLSLSSIDGQVMELINSIIH